MTLHRFIKIIFLIDWKTMNITAVCCSVSAPQSELCPLLLSQCATKRTVPFAAQSMHHKVNCALCCTVSALQSEMCPLLHSQCTTKWTVPFAAWPVHYKMNCAFLCRVSALQSELCPLLRSQCTTKHWETELVSLNKSPCHIFMLHVKLKCKT